MTPPLQAHKLISLLLDLALKQDLSPTTGDVNFDE